MMYATYVEVEKTYFTGQVLLIQMDSKMMDVAEQMEQVILKDPGAR